MAKYVVIDIKKAKIGVAGLKYLTEPALDFKIEVDLPKEIEKEAAKDPLLQQEFKDGALKIMEMAKTETAKKLKAFDALFEGMINKGADEKAVKKQVDTVNSVIKNDLAIYKLAAEQSIDKAWNDLKSKRKEWTKFKIKVGVSIFATLAGLAVSIAAMASSPWSGGAGAAFAIIGFIKAGTKLAQDIAKIAMDIDAAKKQVEVNLAVVEKAVQNKLANAANEVSAAVFQEFLGISQPSVKTTSSAMDTLKAKYAQMVVNVHDLAKNLNKALETQDKLKKEFLAQAAERVKKHPTTDKAGQLSKIKANFEKEMEKLGSKIMDLIGKVGTLYEKIKGWAKTVADLSKRVKDLELKDPKGLKVFREALKFCMLATSIFDGNKVATDMQNIGTGIITAGSSYVYDKIVSKSLDGTIFDAA
jgi:methyl-accepting chemotaxis protein